MNYNKMLFYKIKIILIKQQIKLHKFLSDGCNNFLLFLHT